MMGHREPLINGDEVDYLTRTRHCYNRPRNLPHIKRGFTKRIRRSAKVETITEAEDAWHHRFEDHSGWDAFLAARVRTAIEAHDL
ncbi:hypothetical protein [Chelatococcus sp.]|uniref:hypothetical protein n=1 Tax=Chelatococcus sp. TaxID=1953771 RepID=UPI001EB8F51A|nr:hypothetical protein [Chelatococcus sp.]MBX3546887.1 hypothetical protein [Chelatococcus sp.]